jgi:hypothetical protein
MFHSDDRNEVPAGIKRRVLKVWQQLLVNPQHSRLAKIFLGLLEEDDEVKEDEPNDEQSQVGHHRHKNKPIEVQELFLDTSKISPLSV